MAVTVGATISIGGTSTGSSFTLAHTVNSSTKILVVCFLSATGGLNDPTAVTWNTSESLTRAVENAPPDGGWVSASIWYLMNPTVTSANIVATHTLNNGISGHAANLLGADTSGIGNTATKDQAFPSTTVSNSMTLSGSAGMIIDICGCSSGVSIDGSGTAFGASDANAAGKASYLAYTASPTSTGRNGSSNYSHGLCQLEIKEAAAAFFPKIRFII